MNKISRSEMAIRAVVPDRAAIDQIATPEDLATRNLKYASIDDAGCALLGYQRTKQISRKSRKGWEAGDPSYLAAEVEARKADIIEGAFLEIYQEYLPLLAALDGAKLAKVCDVGCGQGINDVFLHQDFKPAFTLVDIEMTDEQYHLWAAEGSGYASLASAKALLAENGAKRVKAINPTKTKWKQTGHKFDLVTSLYSCGFHYPLDAYEGLFLDTVLSGGSVCVDLRRRYLNRSSPTLDKLKAEASMIPIYEDAKSFRMLFRQA